MVIETDCIVVGQGLAGTALTWMLLERGLSVRIVDAPAGPSASRVAAGLITPVLGRRLAPATGFARCAEVAADHYRRIERETGRDVFTQRDALRLFADAGERARYDARRAALGGRTGPIDVPPDPCLRADHGGALLHGAARLDTVAYLESARAAFRARGLLLEARVAARDVTPDGDSIRLTEPALRARRLIFCGGAADCANPWLPSGAVTPVKGEVLTVQVPELTETRTVHGAGGWLVPAGGAGLYRFGATYERGTLDAAPSAAARDRLGAQLGQLLRGRFDIVDHEAALRPGGAGRRPVVGRHARVSAVAWLNGLGSRGALWAPWLARTLCAHLLDGAPLDLPMGAPPQAGR